MMVYGHRISTALKGGSAWQEHPTWRDRFMSLPPIDLAVFHDNGYVRKQCRELPVVLDMR